MLARKSLACISESRRITLDEAAQLSLIRALKAAGKPGEGPWRGDPRVAPSYAPHHLNCTTGSTISRSASRCQSGSLRRTAERLVLGAGHPEGLEERGELTSHSHDGAFVGVLASAFGGAESPPSEVTVGPGGAEAILGGADEQAMADGLAGFGDVKLGRFGSRATLPGP